jgi:hypothetical protein
MTVELEWYSFVLQCLQTAILIALLIEELRR